jgi:aryl-alcohol dehydrogenase-like predicted oxidoreductase
MTTPKPRPLARRSLLGGALAAAALGACSKKGGAERPDEPPLAPQPGAPREGQIATPPPHLSAAEMPTRSLGRTGVTVSLVGLGGFHIGIPKDERDGVRLVRSALDRGITFLDNCWDYNGGRSEERMGKALRDGYRQRAFLMTKIDGRTKKAAAEQIEQSLRRLGTDHIDLVQIHEVIRPEDPARCFAAGGCIEALVLAQRAGKIRFLGFTGHKDPNIHLAMLREADAHGFAFDTVQMPLNVMDAHYRSFAHEVLPVLQQKGVGVIGMKSMGSGHILRSKAVTALECLHYAMSLPTSVVVTGCEEMGILDQAISAALSFEPMTTTQVAALLARTKDHAMAGRYEAFKTSTQFDGTARNPHWLETSRI